VKIALIIAAAAIVLSLFVCQSCARIGPCVGYERLVCEMYRYWIDADENGVVDRYDSYMWTGKRMHLYQRTYVNPPACGHHR